MSDHDLVGGDPHLWRLAPGRNVCNCFGPCCLVVKEMRCICTECNCQLPWTKNLTAPILELTPEHACVDCGTEVFRNGNRGRYPSRCPGCKEKL